MPKCFLSVPFIKLTFNDGVPAIEKSFRMIPTTFDPSEFSRDSPFNTYIAGIWCWTGNSKCREIMHGPVFSSIQFHQKPIYSFRFILLGTRTEWIAFTQGWAHTMTPPALTRAMWRRAPCGPSRESGPLGMPDPGTWTIRTIPNFSGTRQWIVLRIRIQAFSPPKKIFKSYFLILFYVHFEFCCVLIPVLLKKIAKTIQNLFSDVNFTVGGSGPRFEDTAIIVPIMRIQSKWFGSDFLP